MPFVTQGKTNWKFLVIVIILAILVGVGALWCLVKEEQPYRLKEIKKSEQGALNYKDALIQIFPDKEFSEIQERKDCFQDKENIFYCVENTKDDFLTDSNQKNILVVIREGTYFSQEGQPGYPHAAGIYHAWLAVFDSDTKKILSEPIGLLADGGEINFYGCKGKTYILFTSSVGGQGLVMAGLELFEFKNNKIDRVWHWDSDTTIAETDGDKIAIYELQSTSSDFKCPTKCLWETPSYEEGGEVFSGSVYIYSYDFSWDGNLCRFENNETADWKTYKNEEYGFEINYPKEWLKDESTLFPDYMEEAVESSPSCTFFIPQTKIIPEDVWISVSTRPCKTSSCDPREEMEEPYKKGAKQSMIEGQSVFIFDDAFEGERNLNYILINETKTMQAWLTLAIHHGRQTGTEYIPDEEIEPELQIFQQMLSTFKFLD